MELPPWSFVQSLCIMRQLNDELVREKWGVGWLRGVVGREEIVIVLP